MTRVYEGLPPAELRDSAVLRQVTSAIKVWQVKLTFTRYLKSSLEQSNGDEQKTNV